MDRTDAVTKLIEDHERINDLAAHLEEASNARDVTTASQLADELKNELNLHAAVEEEVFYPALLDIAPALAVQVSEALEDHTVAKAMLFEAAAHEQTAVTTSGNEHPMPESELLNAAVQRHMATEEHLFEAVREAADDSDLEEIGREVDAKREQLHAPPIELDDNPAGRSKRHSATARAAAATDQSIRSSAATDSLIRPV